MFDGSEIIRPALKPLVFGSVCSGIEAASVAWHPLGWRPAFYSEVAAFPRAVLKHRFPEVPCHGDFTTIQNGDYEPIDLLVGGTPCQSFSVAGLRGGLADDRGNLALEFLRLAQRLRPPWVVWENVPGVISDSTQALATFLDGLEELGYIADIDILDAQFFGLAQRRRRVFICAQHRDDLLKSKTPSSLLTIAQCLTEILQGFCLAGSSKFGNARVSSESAAISADGVRRRMKLFGLFAEDGLWPKWREILEEAAAKFPLERSGSDLAVGASEAASTQAELSMASLKEAPSTPIAASWSESLDAALEVTRLYITLTATREITEREIFICSRAVLNIGELILHLNPLLAPFWSAASSSSIAIRDFTGYARSASSDLFTELEWLHPWRDFIGEAERATQSFRDLTIGTFGTVFPLGDRLSGDPPPRREAGEGVARPLAAGSPRGSGYRNDADAAENLIAFGARGGDGTCPLFHVPDLSPALKARDFKGPSSDGDGDGAPLIAHALRGEGFDASKDGSGRGTPIVPICFNSREDPCTTGDVAGALGTSSPQAQAIAFQSSQSGVREVETHATLDANNGSRRHNGVIQDMGVRRLMPIECERLQGLPDDWTLVPYRGKPAKDGPRYKSIGNSMAIPVIRWLGRRIDMVRAMTETEGAR